MTFTSDQQLAALGLKPLAHIPNRHGYRLTAYTRDGRYTAAQVSRDTSGAHHLIVVTPGIVYGDLVGWRDA